MPDEESSFQAVTVAGPGTNAWRWDGQNFKAGPILILMYPGLLVEDLVVSSKAINNYGSIYDASSEKILCHWVKMDPYICTLCVVSRTSTLSLVVAPYVWTLIE